MPLENQLYEPQREHTKTNQAFHISWNKRCMKAVA